MVGLIFECSGLVKISPLFFPVKEIAKIQDLSKCWYKVLSKLLYLNLNKTARRLI